VVLHDVLEGGKLLLGECLVTQVFVIDIALARGFCLAVGMVLEAGFGAVIVDEGGVVAEFGAFAKGSVGTCGFATTIITLSSCTLTLKVLGIDGDSPKKYHNDNYGMQACKY